MLQILLLEYKLMLLLLVVRYMVTGVSDSCVQECILVVCKADQ